MGWARGELACRPAQGRRGDVHHRRGVAAVGRCHDPWALHCVGGHRDVVALQGAGGRRRVVGHQDVAAHQDAGVVRRVGVSGAAAGWAGAWAPPVGFDRGSGRVAAGDVAAVQGAASALVGAIAAGLAVAWPEVALPVWPSPPALVWGQGSWVVLLQVASCSPGGLEREGASQFPCEQVPVGGCWAADGSEPVGGWCSRSPVVQAGPVVGLLQGQSAAGSPAVQVLC